MTDLTTLGIAAIRDGVRDGQFKAREVAEAFNAKVAGARALNAFLVERGGEGDRAPARATAIGRLDARNAGKGGRLADRATGVGAGRAGSQPRRHRRRRPT